MNHIKALRLTEETRKSIALLSMVDGKNDFFDLNKKSINRMYNNVCEIESRIFKKQNTKVSLEDTKPSLTHVVIPEDKVLISQFILDKCNTIQNGLIGLLFEEGIVKNIQLASGEQITFTKTNLKNMKLMSTDIAAIMEMVS